MNFVKLQFSDGRSDVEGIDSVNAVLRSVGVRASTVSIPEEAKPILKASLMNALSEEDQNKLLSIFSLNRAELLEQIDLAGRTPEVHRGGYLGYSRGRYRALSKSLRHESHDPRDADMGTESLWSSSCKHFRQRRGH